MEATARVVLLPIGAGLVYLAIGLYLGDLANARTSSEALKYYYAASLLGYSAIVLAISLLGRPTNEEANLITSAIIGVLCLFGVPLGVSAALQHQHVDVAHHAGLDAVAGRMLLAGRVILALCALRAVPYLIKRALRRETEIVGADTRGLEVLLRHGARAPTRNPDVSRSPFAPCWQLPYCIDYIREVCDPWNKTKRPCWRDKSGCHCDMRYLAKVLQSESADQPKTAIAQRVAQSTSLAFQGERQLDCRECRIYLEHQRRKFRLFSHFALPLTILIIYAARGLLATVWRFVIGSAVDVYGTMAFHEVTEQQVQRIVEFYTSSQAMWIVFVLAGMFLLSGVLRAIEYLILELKI